mmetsp:Transcript_15155/g.45350  ORF Transcript_15155/g.45350 Transcript_15155/m.45350 type:complete len:88 (+) Transcript_15155:2300-2563(+)
MMPVFVQSLVASLLPKNTVDNRKVMPFSHTWSALLSRLASNNYLRFPPRLCTGSSKEGLTKLLSNPFRRQGGPFMTIREDQKFTARL